MYMIQDGIGFIQASIYFSICVMVGAYFLLNLTVAVMLSNYNKMQDTDDKLLKIYQKAFGDRKIDLEQKRSEMKEKSKSMRTIVQ